MTIGVATYVNNFVFPRKEGERLDSRLQKIEDLTREDVKELHQRITALEASLRRELKDSLPYRRGPR